MDTETFSKSYEWDDSSACWIWTKAKSGNGYGAVRFRGKMEAAHRVSWWIHFGEIPDNHCVLHRCDSPLCVNPDHLFLGSHKDNAVDRNKKGRNADVNGERNAAAKLTALDIEVIRSMEGKQRDIARKCGVTQSLVSMIKSGKRWKSV